MRLGQDGMRRAAGRWLSLACLAVGLASPAQAGTANRIVAVGRV